MNIKRIFSIVSCPIVLTPIISTSCSFHQQTPINPSWLIKFKLNTQILNYGDNNKFVNEINMIWIKEKVVQNYQNIFQIETNIPNIINKEFFQNYVDIINIEYNPIEGSVSFICYLKCSTPNYDQIHQEMKFTGFKKELIY